MPSLPAVVAVQDNVSSLACTLRLAAATGLTAASTVRLPSQPAGLPSSTAAHVELSHEPRIGGQVLVADEVGQHAPAGRLT